MLLHDILGFFQLAHQNSSSSYPLPSCNDASIVLGICYSSSPLLVPNLVLVCQDHHNKLPQTVWLKQQKFIISQFWTLESQRSIFLQCSGSDENSLFVLQMAITLLCPHMVLLSVYTERCLSFPLLISSSYSATNPTGIWHHPCHPI